MIFLWHSQSFLQSIRIWDFPGGAVSYAILVISTSQKELNLKDSGNLPKDTQLTDSKARSVSL